MRHLTLLLMAAVVWLAMSSPTLGQMVGQRLRVETSDGSKVTGTVFTRNTDNFGLYVEGGGQKTIRRCRGGGYRWSHRSRNVSPGPDRQRYRCRWEDGKVGNHRKPEGRRPQEEQHRDQSNAPSGFQGRPASSCRSETPLLRSSRVGRSATTRTWVGLGEAWRGT